MLQAKSNNGTLTKLFQLTPAEIEMLRKSMQFFCPTCKERVMIRAGTKTIPHFAHHSKARCHANEGGEGAYHEKGKLLLFSWLQGQGMNVSLEEYIPQIQQRPDIMLRINGKRIAIEYQCARISLKKMLNRTIGYKKLGIIPIWFLGANLFKRSGRNLLKVDQFILQFIHQFSHQYPSTLYFFDPNTTIFISATDLYLTQKKQAIAKFRMKKLEKISFREIFKTSSVSRNLLLSEWKKAKYRFRLYQPRKLFGKELAWNQWLYLKGTHREYLPSVIYLPVSSQIFMDTAPWDWQSRICLEVIDPIPVGGEFSIIKCLNKLQKSSSKQSFPLVKSSINPILEYLQILCSLQVIKQISTTQFMKCKSFHHYSQLEHAISGDNKLMDDLCDNFQANYEHDS